jgi:hypothetical protein
MRGVIENSLAEPAERQVLDASMEIILLMVDFDKSLQIPSEIKVNRKGAVT